MVKFALYLDANSEEIPDCNCDIIAIGFGSDVEKSYSRLKFIISQTDKKLMICGCGKEDIDSVLLPELANYANDGCIISYATEKTYKKIVPSVIAKNHSVILKTPIDINLAKELNILALELGLKKEKIIMNPDIGALGYGYEYGYSIIEKIKLEKKDEYLQFPIISDAALEAIKTKEAKTSAKRAKMIELCALSGVIAAGADIVTVTNPEVINILKRIS